MPESCCASMCRAGEAKRVRWSKHAISTQTCLCDVIVCCLAWCVFHRCHHRKRGCCNKAARSLTQSLTHSRWLTRSLTDLLTWLTHLHEEPWHSVIEWCSKSYGSACSPYHRSIYRYLLDPRRAFAFWLEIVLSWGAFSNLGLKPLKPGTGMKRPRVGVLSRS